MHKQLKVQTLNHDAETGWTDIKLPEDTIYISLSNGNKIGIELFERVPNLINIRGYTGGLVLLPEASNVVKVGINK